MTDLPSRIRVALESLGDTPDAVAETLRRAGFRGLMDRAICCPVAKYLASTAAEGMPVSVSKHYGGNEKLPAAVVAFLDGFDSGLYPDLVEGA